MTRPRQPGLHDPFWYEATFAERFIVEMLNPDSGIQSVTMQAPDVRGIDDVVVKYHTKPTAYHQIKHTRSGDTLSFADLTSESDGASLLHQLAEGWAAVTRDGGTCETYLVTNRAMTVRPSSTGIDVGEELPALTVFWPWLTQTLATVGAIDEIKVPDEWRTAWQRWLAQLDPLSSLEQMQFLRSLSINASEPSLPGLERATTARLAVLFGIPEDTAERALAQLDHHMREWATSERGANVEITAERAWSAFALGGWEMVGTHAFPPPAPFFPTRETFLTELTTLLGAATGGVYFLTGPAGCGKSSIVSALANRAEPVVDLRFHAFKPLTPYEPSIPEDAGRAVTAAALWGDLLVQMRTFFRGRLWANRVPVRNDFLLDDPSRLKNHVLRLAKILAQERQRPTVIAIDGLDHAARAKHLTPEVLKGRLSLLASLVPPDEVPNDIVFLIAGQPGWEAYPSWLRVERPDVRVIDVPAIDAGDIATLLRANSGVPLDQIDAAARVIADLTKGNTLSAVYAVAEAQSIADTGALQTHLERRRLGSSLEEYYSTIWSAALDSFKLNSNQLVAALALSTARLTPQLLAGFFPDAGLGPAQWNAILGRLTPIVESMAGTYAIRHNDLRVFLMTQLQADRQSLVDAASAMATYYARAPAAEAKHADLLRLLEFAERQSEIPAAFSPVFVSDAVALRRPIAEVIDQAKTALASVTKATAWDDVHTLALGLATVQQARTIVEYYQLAQTPRAVPPYLVSEARVLPQKEWSLRAIERLCTDARTLLAAGERDRAGAVMRRWVGKLSPIELAAVLEAQPGALEPWEHRDVKQRIGEIIRVCGELAQSVGVNRATLSEQVTETSASLLATFYGGWLRAGVKAARPWPRTLRMPPVWWDADVEACVKDLAEQERWSDVLASLDLRRDDRDRMTFSFHVRAAEWAIRAHAPANIVAVWVEPIAEGGFTAITALEDRYDLELLDLYVGVAFAIGYVHVARPSSAVSEEGATAYFTQYHDRRTDEHVRRLLYAAAWTGKLLRAVHSRRAEEALFVQASEVAAVAKSLLTPAWSKPAFVPQAFLSHAPPLLKLIFGALTEADHHIDAALAPVLLAYAAERRAAQPLEVVWHALAARGHRDVLRSWMQDWIGDHGRAWIAELGDRFAIVRLFADLARECGWNAEADHAEERLRWNQLGYSGHKDYSLSVPLQWFKDLASRESSAWETEGVRLLSVSDEASRTGDNRVGGQIDEAIATAAARCGPAALWRLAVGTATARRERFAVGDGFALEGIAGALATESFTGDELCHLWCLTIGALVWEVESGRTRITWLRDALLGAASRLRLADVRARMQAVAPFEFSLPESRYGQSASGSQEELEAEFRATTIGDAVSKLADRVQSSNKDRLSDVWRGAAVCGERLQHEHPVNHAELVRTLSLLLRYRDEGYSWSFSSFGSAVGAILPLLPDPEQRMFRAWTVETIDTADSPDIWLVAASDNLRTLVRLYATTATAADVRAGLERELRMHETWILGPSRENRRPWPAIDISPIRDEGPISWAAFAFSSLIDLLGSRSSARCRAAIKGLFSLLAMEPTTNALGVEIWNGLDRERRYLLLTLLERLATEHPSHFAVWQPLAEAELRAGGGVEQLQAWVTLDAFARATAVPPDRWQLPSDEPHMHGEIARIAERLLEIPRNTMGTVGLSYGRSSARQIAHMFAAAIGEDKAIAEALVADHLNNLATRASSADIRPPEEILDGDMKMVHGDGVIETQDFLMEEARAGCFGVVEPRALAQALLMNDEPRFLTNSGIAASDAGAWPIDDALDALVSRGEAAVREALVPIASAAIAESECLLAAELETYSRGHDVILYYETGWMKDVLAHATRHPPLTFNGRAHLLSGEAGYEPRQSKAAGWFTFRAGGLGTFIHSNISLMPAGIWRMFGWEPAVGNPLIWMCEERVVARCELVRGPIRDTVQDFLHRQPVLLRWVVDQSAFEAATASIGVPIRASVELEVAAVPRD